MVAGIVRKGNEQKKIARIIVGCIAAIIVIILIIPPPHTYTLSVSVNHVVNQHTLLTTCSFEVIIHVMIAHHLHKVNVEAKTPLKPLHGRN